MTDQALAEQAAALTSVLQKLIRRLFTLDTDDPAIELPVAQVRVCSILRDGSRSMSCLSREMGISLSATTQIADRLERAGMVERITEADDRRVKFLQLTPRGVEIMVSRNESRIRRVQEALERLPADTRDEALRVLRDLASAAPTVGEGMAVAERLEG